jgi:hypothetical protein
MLRVENVHDRVYLVDGREAAWVHANLSVHFK